MLYWEELRSTYGGSSRITLDYRAKVPGGWLVRATGTSGANPSLTFVPDPEHKWNP